MKKFTLFLTALCFSAFINKANAQTWNIGSPNATDVTATLSGSSPNYTLTISGTGAMQDFETPPWWSIRTKITTLVINTGITTIGNWAFDDCSGLTGTLTIPNSVTSIGNCAFDGCYGLTGTLTIPNSVTAIGNYAFSGCSGLTGTLTIPNSVITIGNSAFSGCSGLTGTLTIPNSVTTIGKWVFYHCSGLTGTLTIPNSVTTIGDVAFADCSGLTAVTIGNSVTTIGDQAFQSCSGLTVVTIGNSVTTIGTLAFIYCSSLTSVINLNKYPQNITSVVFYIFEEDTDIGSATLTVPACALNDYRNAAVWNTFGTIIGDATLPCEGTSNIATVEANNITLYPNPVKDELQVTSYELRVTGWCVVQHFQHNRSGAYARQITRRNHHNQRFIIAQRRLFYQSRQYGREVCKGIINYRHYEAP
ncbi:MAG: leucine-rich repeat domain-containing protein [Paludibacter sp.]|nr:leucine-rich repeat domain-containing protein [Paludibacter sp.]